MDTLGIFGKLGKECKEFKRSTGGASRIVNVNNDAARLFRSGSLLKLKHDNTILRFPSMFTENTCSCWVQCPVSDIHFPFLVLSIKILYFIINLPISSNAIT